MKVVSTIYEKFPEATADEEELEQKTERPSTALDVTLLVSFYFPPRYHGRTSLSKMERETTVQSLPNRTKVYKFGYIYIYIGRVYETH